jgi:alkylation response protein AidB-like acyl-CoA dehydrogenase
VNAAFDLYTLPEEHRLLRATVRALVDAKIAPRAAEIDEAAEFPWDVHDALVAAELHAVHVPEDYEGVGADAVASAIVIEEIARACASSSLIPAVNKLGTMGLLLAGDDALKEAYLPRLARGEGMFSYCLSEPDAGSDAANLKTRAVRDGDDWVINGTKRWITNAGVSRFYTVMVVTDPEKGPNGISAFVVEATDGLTFGAPERKLGIKGSPTAEVYFDDVRIPGERMIGEQGTGFKTALRTLDHTRLTIGAQALGIAAGAVEFCTRYVQERKQFGQPISAFQGVAFTLADMAMKTEAARSLIYTAAAHSERLTPELTFMSAAAKCFASDTAMSVTTDGVQLLGGYGYTKDFPLERMMRDAKITQIYEGTNQIQRMVMARSLFKANPVH